MLSHRASWFVPVLIVGFIGTPTATRADDKSATVAHIRLTGSLDETPIAADPLFGISPENFQTKLDRLRQARKDAKVQAVYLELDGLSVGWGKLDELSRAVADCRAAGKKVYAYLEAGNSMDYLVAVNCDDICMPEAGWLLLVGLRGGATFYKNLFDKIGVQADMLQMGDFKGAAEPFTRDRMSPEFRQQLELVLDAYFDRGLVERIAKGRTSHKWTTDQVKQLIDKGPYTAKAALQAGLIDRVAYATDYQNAIKADLKVDQLVVEKNYGSKKKQEIDFGNPFAILKLLSPPKPTSSSKPKVAVLYATGVITTGKSGESLFAGPVTGSTTMVQAIRQAEQDETVKAIVLRVDSPGGSALASDLIWHELRQCKKPVIASMGDTAASGGYYISMGCRKIYAEPGTLTGSIGVVGGKLVLGGLEKKVGLNTEVITRGVNANILSTDSPFSPSERQAMTAMMKDVYDQFLAKALEGRKQAGKKMTMEDLEKLAGGRIWTGWQAKDSGLIDELGTLADAITAAKEMAGEKDTEMELLILPKPKSFFEQLLDPQSDAQLPDVQLPLLRDLPHLAQSLDLLHGLLRLNGEPVWAIMPCRVEVK
ncbi:MAG: signal peptide peptidase SppA [Gemmataceae bacterium]